VGGAVVRNRAKRRLRPLVQVAALPDGVDVVVVARGPRVAAAPSGELAAAFSHACGTALRKVAA
jgi:ribonuclease P protein component